MWVSNGKKTYQMNYFVNVVVIQSNVLTMILGGKNPMYPDHEWYY
jgi:hypothetical protein